MPNYLTRTATGDIEQSYTYNTSGRVASVEMSGAATQSMSYANGQLSELARTANSKQQKYLFNYDGFGNMTQMKVSGSGGSQTLASYEYESGVNNGRLSKLSYGNGAYVQYTYDIFDRIEKESYNDGREYNYKYSTEGQLSEQSSTNEKYEYGYDSLGRLINSTEYNGGSFEQRTYQAYDESNRLVSQVLKNTAGTTAYTYGYASATGLLQSLSVYLPGNTYNPVASSTPSIDVAYAYNGLNQLQSKTVTNGTAELFTRAFSYRQIASAGDRRSDQVAIMNYRKGSGDETTFIYGDKYYYDASGRLTKVTDSSNNDSLTNERATYSYTDGQLTGAKVGSTNYAYSYDEAGNLLTKTDGGTTKTYTYGNTKWADLLTAYDGKAITYDGCGNPTTYYDSKAFTWSHGRQLTAVNTNISYAYDMAGVRSSKTVSGTTYKFTTLSGLVTRQSWGSNYIEFIYDESSQPFAMRYNGTLYYYVLNIQGDVVGLLNASGTMVATYTYDPWGKVISNVESGSLADLNPLRYRGYYYDSETGFYYLQSRYYDPAIGRFINADTYATTDATNARSSNMFAYCENDPVNRSDSAGEFFDTVFDVVSLGMSIVDVVSNPANPWAWASLAGDVIDLIPGVTGVGETIRATKGARKMMDNASDAAKELKRPYIRKNVRDAVLKNAKRSPTNELLDANTSEVIRGSYDLGHKYGREFKHMKEVATSHGWSQKKFNNYMNNPKYYQIESPYNNRSHAFERKW